jgi:hypothetical protein
VPRPCSPFGRGPAPGRSSCWEVACP